jgi:hypothetical protein
MSWNEVVERVTPYVVKIETPQGHGTGFLCFYNHDRTLLGIATANHVVQQADEWQQPIRIKHFPSKGVRLVQETERVIYTNEHNDSALILVGESKELQLPSDVIPLLPQTLRLPIGADVGWLGYPGVERDTLCFFAGVISTRKDERSAYLIDGVSIHGISGGPVIYSTPTDGVHIVGSISAYIVNRSTGEALPGLAVAQDVSHFHDTITRIRSIDEARRVEASKPAQGEQHG